MKFFFRIFLKIVRKLYLKIVVLKKPPKSVCEQHPDKASSIIFDALMSDTPCMIARFGSTELICLKNYLGVKNNKGKYIDFIKGKAQAWWWEENIIHQMQQWSGFFPARENKIVKFCELMLQDIPEVNVLGSWLADESLFAEELKNAEKIHLRLLEPYWADNHWSRALEGKKVLVVHPFAKDIELQYQKRELIFKKTYCLVFN